jgi:hypothetical protein
MSGMLTALPQFVELDLDRVFVWRSGVATAEARVVLR